MLKQGYDFNWLHTMGEFTCFKPFRYLLKIQLVTDFERLF